MGESVVVLQSYSFVASLPRNDESLEDNSMNAISQSVSLGRFMTEDLEWGKWSCFSHKKYVDEAEKYSQPGSVAQKKAFFEDYYKSISLAKQAKNASDESFDPKHEPESVVVLLNTLKTLTKDESDDETEVVLSSEVELERKSGLDLEQEEEETVVLEGMEDEENHIEDVELLKKSSYVGDDEEEEESVVHGEMKDKENHTEDEELLKKSSSVLEEEEERRLSMEKSEASLETPEEALEIVFTQKISERPETHSLMKRQEKPVRQRFSFLNCFMGNTKTQDQKNTTKKKKPTKLFLCLCFKP